jgi:hypothetical protein
LDNNTVLSFAGHLSTDRIFYEKLSITDAGIKLKKFIGLGNDQYLIKTNKDVYLYKNNTLCKITDIPNRYCNILFNYSFDSSDYNYYYSIDNNVYMCKMWQEISQKDIYKIFSVRGATTVNDLLPINTYTWLIATNNGLYKSSYEYVLEQDLTYFNDRNVNDIYKNELSTTI